MTKKRFSVFVLILLGISFFSGSVNSRDTFELVKSALSDTIYYVDGGFIRHPFPNKTTYESWYGNDFSKVVTLSDEFLSTIPLGGNITFRSGVFLLKVPSRPEVYAVEPGGVLRHITDAGIAEYIYGNEWEKRIRDLPEVFFSNYTIGEEIKDYNTIPDGTLYKMTGEQIYYWKNDNILTKFAGIEDLRANGFDTKDAILNPRAFFTRDKVAKGFNSSIFNPAMKPNKDIRDCEAERLRAAFVFLYQGDLKDEDVNQIVRYQNALPGHWKKATDSYSEIDTSFPLVLLQNEPGLFTRINKFNRFDVGHEVGFAFYEKANDTFDFLIIFTNFPVGEKNEATFSPVTNAISGIGKYQLDRSEIFGSRGKLKGIINMGDIITFSDDTPRLIDSALNSITHEILHQWSGALYFIDDKGVLNSSLLSEDLYHWSPWVTFTSPLGGFGWDEVRSGVFAKDSNLSETVARNFSTLDLYAMGFIPYRSIPPVGYIETAIKEPNGNEIEGVLRKVNIEQIRAANGGWMCQL